MMDAKAAEGRRGRVYVEFDVRLRAHTEHCLSKQSYQTGVICACRTVLGAYYAFPSNMEGYEAFA